MISDASFEQDAPSPATKNGFRIARFLSFLRYKASPSLLPKCVFSDLDDSVTHAS